MKLRFIIFAYGYPIAPAPFVEQVSIFPLLNCFCTFIKSQLGIYVWVYFWLLSWVLLVYVSICWYHTLDYYSYVVSPNIRQSGSSVFKMVWLIQRLVSLHINFRTSLSISTNPVTPFVRFILKLFLFSVEEFCEYVLYFSFHMFIITT